MVTTTAEFDQFSQRVNQLLAIDDGPAAFQLLEENKQFGDVKEYKLLACSVLLKIGRYELCQEVAGKVLVDDPSNELAINFLGLISTATTPPKAECRSVFQRSFSTSIPQPFLGRLQDSVHHYSYRGVQMVKSPFDMALYPLLIWNLKPRTIIEIGSKEGGSALWFADQIRNFNLDTKILSIDLIRVEAFEDPLVTFYAGNGRALNDVLTEDILSSLPRPWLVIEDADHTEKTSLAVLEFFDQWLDVDDRIVVEDGIMSDLYPEAFPEHSSGPHLALKAFLHERGEDYEVDAYYCDFFGYNVTWSPNGILKRLGRLRFN